MPIDEQTFGRLEAVARLAFAEMMTFGYTSIAEFHYLHGYTEDGGKPDWMYQAILQAAADTGIRLTYVPILYERAGFDLSRPTEAQRRFTKTLDAFIEHYDDVRDDAPPNVSVAIGAHSLRAVEETSLARLSEIVERDRCPMHIHIAEQTGEVKQCLARHNARPVEWLLNEVPVNEHWCLVHATHVTETELDQMSQAGSVICLCPSTEANLGDGLFPLRAWLERGGRIAIGSDSHVTNNPFEELRWLEYGQRLSSRSRNIAAMHDGHSGRSLFDRVLKGGGLACGHGDTRLQPGAKADILTLDATSPMLAGHRNDSILDALVFTGAELPIDRVMVGGQWHVINGQHVSQQTIEREFLEVVNQLWPSK